MNNGGILGFKWKEDPTLFNLGCGSSSCKYVKPTGMVLNGPCRCYEHKPHKVEQFLLRNISALHKESQQLQLSLDIENKLKED